MPLGYYQPAYGAAPARTRQNVVSVGGGRRAQKTANFQPSRSAQQVIPQKRVGSTKGLFRKPQVATGPSGNQSSRTSTTTTTTTTPTTTTDTPSTTTQAPSWASALYLAEMTALVGQTIPSNFYAGTTFTIKTVSLDGFDAPVITVTPASGAGTDIAPNTPQWTDTASQVLSAAAAAASGAGSSSSGNGSGGASSGGGGGGVTVVTDQPSTPEEAEQVLADEATATVEAMTVSTDVAQGMGEEGFFSKYKWWLLGGAAIVAYTQREAIMRMVKR